MGKRIGSLGLGGLDGAQWFGGSFRVWVGGGGGGGGGLGSLGFGRLRVLGFRVCGFATGLRGWGALGLCVLGFWGLGV